MASDDDSQPDYSSSSDAETMRQHAKITGDPERHAAALAHLQEEHENNQSAIKGAQNKLRGKVKKGLKKAFPSAGDSGATPFQRAGKSGGTPYDIAEGK